MKRHIIIIAAILISCCSVAQQSNTFYYMDRVLQSQYENTAIIDINYRTQVGGLIIPIFGQVPPCLALNFVNNSFHYNHLIHHGEGLLRDSLIIDEALFKSKLQRFNHFRMGLDLELFNIGVKMENMLLTVSLSEKVRGGMTFPRDLFEFVLDGNVPAMYDDRALDFSRFGPEMTYYRELAVGGSIKATRDLTIGARLKILFGLANVTSDVRKFSLRTDPNDYHWHIDSDMDFKFSMPIKFDYQAQSRDSVNFDLRGDGKINIVDALLNFRNMGLGFDVGVNYRFNPKFDMSFSAIDLGFINWNDNPQVFSTKGEFDFRGLEINGLPRDSAERADLLYHTVDEAFDTFMPEMKDNQSYTTWLHGNLYLGLRYKVIDKLHLTALYRGEFYRKSYLQSVTLGVNSNLTSWCSAHLTWSMANNTAANVGLGLTLRAGFVNWYIVSDNIIGPMIPQKCKQVNLRIGCNMIFGVQKQLKSYARL